MGCPGAFWVSGDVVTKSFDIGWGGTWGWIWGGIWGGPGELAVSDLGKSGWGWGGWSGWGKQSSWWFFSETQKVWKVVFEGNAAKYKTNQTYRSVSIMFLFSY